MSRNYLGRIPRCFPPRALSFNTPGTKLPGLTERVIRRVAAIYDLNAAASADQDVIFTATNPSPRLRWSITVGWELVDGAIYVPGSATPTWQMRAIRYPAQGGPAADLDNIFASARTLPDGYEVDSAVKNVRGTLTLHDGAGFDLDSGLSGPLVIEARWEPHDGANDADLQELYSRCSLEILGVPPVFSVTP